MASPQVFGLSLAFQGGFVTGLMPSGTWSFVIAKRRATLPLICSLSAWTRAEMCLSPARSAANTRR